MEATDGYLRPARSLSSGVLPSRQMLGGELSISEGVAPGYYLVVPSRHQSACGVLPSTLKGLQAHSPGQSEATPWGMDYIILYECALKGQRA